MLKLSKHTQNVLQVQKEFDRLQGPVLERYIDTITRICQHNPKTDDKLFPLPAYFLVDTERCRGAYVLEVKRTVRHLIAEGLWLKKEYEFHCKYLLWLYDCPDYDEALKVTTFIDSSRKARKVVRDLVAMFDSELELVVDQFYSFPLGNIFKSDEELSRVPPVIAALKARFLSIYDRLIGR